MSDFQKFLRENLNNIFNKNPNDSLLTNLGFTIRQERKKCGYSQRELATRTNISQANISRIEKGLSNISINQLKKIADALQLRIKIELE